MSLVVPAVLPLSRKDLDEKLELFSRISSIRRVQIDVVDGKFASPSSWPYTAFAEFETMVKNGGTPSGVPMREMLPRLHDIVYEIDLMCLDAESAAGEWLALGASRLTFHAESATDLSRLLASVRKRYSTDTFTSLISFGLALNIASELSLIEPHLGEINYVQFMGIAKIGRQGQPFDRRVLERIRVFHARHPEIPIQVDGGISLESAKKLIALGVSNLIIGSAIVRAKDPAAVVAEFEALETSYGI